MSDPVLFPVAPAGAGGLRERLDRPEVLIAPGAFDGLSARLLEAAGLGIAFQAKPLVRATAEQSLSTLGLDGILYLIGMSDREVAQA